MTTSPFIDSSAVAAAAAASVIDFDQLDDLIARSLAAKLEAERQKAIYDSLRDQICATVKNLGESKLESASGKIQLKETKSGWTFSQATENLSTQLKAQQQIEKRNGTAQPSKVTISADVFPL